VAVEGVEVDRVAGLQQYLVALDNDPQRALQDVGVGVQGDGVGLGPGHDRDEERLHLLVDEVVREALVVVVPAPRVTQNTRRRGSSPVRREDISALNLCAIW